jgi:hypothetical protein
MAVITQLRFPRSKVASELTQSSEEESVVSHLAGRLIQITLAVYLSPALLAVLMVGGIGIFFMKCSRLYVGLAKIPTE